MPSTNDPENDHGLFALFVGPTGSGKSVGALSFPNPHVADFDKKMPGVAKKHFPGKEIFWDTYKDIFEVSDQINLFKATCPYETLIMDSVTSLVNLTLNTIGNVKGEKVIDMLRTLGRKGNIELMGIDYYNGETNFIQRYWIDELKSLWARPGNPKNVIIIAHVITTESAPDLRTKIVTKTRSIVTAGRKVAAFIPSQFDDLWLFGTIAPELGSEGPVRHVMTTETTGEDSAKTAYNLPTMIDFTGGSLYDMVKGYINPRERTL